METNHNTQLAAIEKGLLACQEFIAALDGLRRASWVQDSTTKLYHYYEVEPEMAAQPALCEGPVLLTGVVRRKAGPLPEGLKTRYANSNRSAIGRHAGICKACSLRLEALFERNANEE